MSDLTVVVKTFQRPDALRRLLASIRQKSTTDYMEAVVIGNGFISLRASLVKTVSALFSISSGGSIGREGPLVQLSALVASLIGQLRQFPVPQRRHLEGKYVESIKEILAERALLDRGRQITIRGGDDPNIDLNPLPSSHALEFMLLEHSQQRDLCVG